MQRKTQVDMENVVNMLIASMATQAQLVTGQISLLERINRRLDNLDMLNNRLNAVVETLNEMRGEDRSDWNDAAESCLGSIADDLREIKVALSLRHLA